MQHPQSNETTMPAVAFAAKSTADNGSIGTQLEDCRNLAKTRGLDLVAEFQDVKASAYSGDRGQGLADAKAECERQVSGHGSCALLIQHSDRLARGDAKTAKHLVEYTLWALKARVTIISKQDPEMFPEGEYGLLMGAIGGMRNHQDSKRKSLSVKDGLRRRVEAGGKYIGGRRPYGYRWSPELDGNGDPVTTRDGRIVKRLVIDEHERAVVRRIFSEYVRGIPQYRIANDLNDDGVKTLTYEKTGAAWYATTVAGMLRNELYVGRVVLGGESFPAVGPDGRPTHEPIIDSEMWEKARQLREATAESGGRGRGRRTAGRHLLMNGLLRCTCGSPMSPVTKNKTNPGDLYETYSCVRRLHHGPDKCSQGPIKRAIIDGSLMRYFEQVALDVAGTRQWMNDQAAQKLTQFGALHRQAQLELVRAESALTRIEGDYLAEKITAEQWTRLEDRLRGEMAAARAQAEQQDRHRESIAREIASFDSEATIAEELTALRQIVTGQVRDGSREGLDSFRATLKRVFVGFELATPSKPFGSGALQGQGVMWSPGGPDSTTLKIADGSYLLPKVRDEAIDLSPSADYGEGFPAVRRASLLLHDNLCSRLDIS